MDGDRICRLVVCGWIRNEDGHVLLTQRRPGKHLELLWEFPGGKVEQGESLASCLKRELLEEIGILAEIGRECARHVHAYSDFDVELVLMDVVSFTGEIQKLEIHDFKWVEPHWLLANEALLPEADKPLLQKTRHLLFK